MEMNLSTASYNNGLSPCKNYISICSLHESELYCCDTSPSGLREFESINRLFKYYGQLRQLTCGLGRMIRAH